MKHIYLFLVAILLFSCNGKKENRSYVVATTAWTAAVAEAAGATDIIVLAPYEMQHPSEYELRPGDIAKLMEAKLIVYAGYEIMAERIRNGLEIPPDRLLRIETSYHFDKISKAVLSVAERLGTTDTARKNIQEILEVYEDGKKKISEKGLSEIPVAVQFFQRPISEELGLKVAYVFGPAAPEATEISAVSKMHLPLIIDNQHNPVGKPFAEIQPDARYVQLLNFPGMDGTRSLQDVIRRNIAVILGK